MGCGNSKEASSPVARREENNHHRRKSSSSSHSTVKKHNRSPTPRDPTPPPKDPSPPPRDPTPPPKGDDDDNEKRTYNLMGGPGYFDTTPREKDPTPEPKDPTPPPPSPPPPAPPNDTNDNVNEGEVTGPDAPMPDSDDKGEQQDLSGQQDAGPNDAMPETEGQHEEQNHSGEQTEGPGVPSPIAGGEDDTHQQHISGQHEDDKHDRRDNRPDKRDQGSKDGYVKSDYGIHEKFVDFRPNPEPLDQDYADAPTSRPFEDPDFGPSVAIKGENVEWKRPGEFRPGAVLFSSGATRFDIGQGSAGTCWFLSTVAMLADKPELFHRVVPKDAWNQEGGYFCCKFWRFGEWENVYIDDRLPVIHGDQLWGAKSADDPNEMWPALLEKAFARFHGNYNSVYGGQSGDAYLALTGGLSEYIDFDKAFEDDNTHGTKAKALHSRLTNSVNSGALICTEVPGEYDKQHGLIGGHAYSLTGASQVVNTNGEPVYLVRVRNPWGHTEWNGPWCDNGPEWNSLPKGELSHNKKDDGEFWMELQHFVKYFSGVTICSMTPDFDQDGCEDTINCCTTLCGNWQGETAAGFQNRINNPKFSFHVDDEGMDTDGLVPIVVQICQKLQHRQKNKASIRVDLYQVLAEESGKSVYVLQLLGKVTNVYKKERQMSSRYKVEPGQYVVLPSTIDPGVEKEYLVRIFSPNGLIDMKELPPGSRSSIMSSDEFEPPEVSGVDNKIRFCECNIGSWRCNDNAGGQVSQKTFHVNPQVEFEIPERGPQLVNITLMQSARSEGNPVGTRLFELDGGYEVTKSEGHLEYLYNHYEESPQSVNDGGQGVFINGSSAQITYVLPPGRRYSAILHMDDQDTENDFAVVVRSTCALNLKLHNF